MYPIGIKFFFEKSSWKTLKSILLNNISKSEQKILQFISLGYIRTCIHMYVHRHTIIIWNMYGLMCDVHLKIIATIVAIVLHII